jgi:hypothetical protein
LHHVHYGLFTSPKYTIKDLRPWLKKKFCLQGKAGRLGEPPAGLLQTL